MPTARLHTHSSVSEGQQQQQQSSAPSTKERRSGRAFISCHGKLCTSETKCNRASAGLMAYGVEQKQQQQRAATKAHSTSIDQITDGRISLVNYWAHTCSLALAFSSLRTHMYSFTPGTHRWIWPVYTMRQTRSNTGDARRCRLSSQHAKQASSLALRSV
jgi:hypothetical protein